MQQQASCQGQQRARSCNAADPKNAPMVIRFLRHLEREIGVLLRRSASHEGGWR
jgi:hypothetical protein